MCVFFVQITFCFVFSIVARIKAVGGREGREEGRGHKALVNANVYGYW